MSTPINDTFQVRIQGQLIDCIKAVAYQREVVKNAYSFFFCDYAKTKELINLKRACNPTDNSAFWVASAAGNYPNADGLSYTAFKQYDVLYTETADGTNFTNSNLGNLFTDKDSTARVPIYDNWDDVYAMTNLPKGYMVVVEQDGRFVIYTKTTQRVTATTAADWSSIGSSGSSIESYLDIPDKPDIYYVLRAANETVADAIDRIVGDDVTNYGDIVVVKTTSNGMETGDIIDMDSYIYNGTDFISMNGHLDITKIVFPQDITLSGAWTSIGNIKKSDGVFHAKGMSLWEFIDIVFNGTVTPTILTAPALTISADASGAKEIGTTVSQRFTIGFTDGKYECAGDEEAMNAFIDSYTIKYEGTGGNVSGEPAAVVRDDRTDGVVITGGTAGSFHLPENYSKRFSIYANIKTNKAATNNKGATTSVKYIPETQTITIETVPQVYSHFVQSAVLSSYRVGAFYGSRSTALTASETTTSNMIRSLNSSNGAYPTSGSKTYTFNVGAGAKQLVVAVLHGKTAPELYNETVHSGFDLQLLKQVDVAGADGANLASYDVYVYTPAIEFRTTNTIRVTINA